MNKLPEVKIRPLTSKNWRDLETLFGPKGACAGCWCMYWRQSRAQFEQGHGQINHDCLKSLVDSGTIPGILAYVQLHPFEYTYYNQFIGGTSQAASRFETDYWLTCYKDAVDQLNMIRDPINLYVHREAYIAGYYADPNITVHELRGAANEVQSGDYVLVNTRTNEDRRILKDVPPQLQVARGKALFCVIKRVP